MSHAVVISILSLVVSVSAVIVAFRAFTVTQRPYVGIVEAAIVFQSATQGATPTAFQYQFTIKNVGALPARLTVERHRAMVTAAGKTIELPVKVSPSNISILMPGQPVFLAGTLNDNSGLAKVADILAGSADLNVEVVLSYQAVSGHWWPSTYYYRVKNHLRTPERQFEQVSSEAD